MDLSGSLLPFLQGILLGTLLVLNMLAADASALFSSISSSLSDRFATQTEEPAPIAATSTSPIAASSTPSIVATPATTTTKIAVKTPIAVKTATTTKPAAPKTPPTPLLSAEQVNENARASVVNILCLVSGTDSVRSISGSGVIIDSRGIVLTNAHIAQYFLLKDYPTASSTDCTIRIGSPATPTYRAELIYLPPAWITANASQITSEHGTGTGENDYAFLRITSRTNPNASLPSIFTNLPMSASIDTGDQVLVAGYPAGFLDAQTIERSLYATSAFTAIGQLYTFDDPKHIDVVSLGGTVVSQGGSSGGAVMRTYDGELAGLIATATVGTTTADRDLRAITIGYIDRSLREAGKGGLVEFLSGNLDQLAKDFAPTFASEKQTLIKAITK